MVRPYTKEVQIDDRWVTLGNHGERGGKRGEERFSGDPEGILAKGYASGRMDVIRRKLQELQES